MFFRGALFWRLYYQQIKDENSDVGMGMFIKYPRFYKYMKLFLPILIVGFVFNALAASLSAFYMLILLFGSMGLDSID